MVIENCHRSCWEALEAERARHAACDAVQHWWRVGCCQSWHEVTSTNKSSGFCSMLTHCCCSIDSELSHTASRPLQCRVNDCRRSSDVSRCLSLMTYFSCNSRSHLTFVWCWLFMDTYMSLTIKTVYNVSYILCLKCCGTKIQIHLTTTDLKVYVKITCRKFRS